MATEDDPMVLKQWVSVIDKRTTLICLHAAGQIQKVDEPFQTLNGEVDHPPVHVHCRSQVVPWMPGFVNETRKEANAELLLRPLKERLKADLRTRSTIPRPMTTPLGPPVIVPVPDGDD